MDLPPVNQRIPPTQHRTRSLDAGNSRINTDEFEALLPWATALEPLSLNLEESFQVLRKKDHTCNFAFFKSGKKTWERDISNRMSEVSDGDCRNGPVAIREDPNSTGQSPPNWMQTLARFHKGHFRRSGGGDPANYYQGSVNGFLVTLTRPQWDLMRLYEDDFLILVDSDRTKEMNAMGDEMDQVYQYIENCKAHVADATLYLEELNERYRLFDGMPGRDVKLSVYAEQSLSTPSLTMGDIQSLIDNGHSDEVSCEKSPQWTFFQPVVDIQPNRQISRERLSHTPVSMQGQMTQELMESVLSTEDSAMCSTEHALTDTPPRETNTLSATQDLASHVPDLQLQISTPTPSPSDESPVSSIEFPHDAITFAVPVKAIPTGLRLSTPISTHENPVPRTPAEKKYGLAFTSNLRSQGVSWPEIRIHWKVRFHVWRTEASLRYLWSRAKTLVKKDRSGNLIFKVPKTTLRKLKGDSRSPAVAGREK